MPQGRIYNRKMQYKREGSVLLFFVLPRLACRHVFCDSVLSVNGCSRPRQHAIVPHVCHCEAAERLAVAIRTLTVPLPSRHLWCARFSVRKSYLKRVVGGIR